MAMYPNAARGYMPFVGNNGKKHVKRAAVPSDKTRSTETKTYRVTLRDRQGFCYTYIIQADGTKSLPVLCDKKINSPGGLLASSLPNMKNARGAATAAKRHGLASTDALDRVGKSSSDESAKKGIFNSLLRFIKKRTGSSTKSKRKPRPLPQRKRQRTISAMSNLDPIQESPEEDNLEEEEEEEEVDDESYTHDSASEETDDCEEATVETVKPSTSATTTESSSTSSPATTTTTTATPAAASTTS